MTFQEIAKLNFFFHLTLQHIATCSQYGNFIVLFAELAQYVSIFVVIFVELINTVFVISTSIDSNIVYNTPLFPDGHHHQT